MPATAVVLKLVHIDVKVVISSTRKVPQLSGNDQLLPESPFAAAALSSSVEILQHQPSASY